MSESRYSGNPFLPLIASIAIVTGGGSAETPQPDWSHAKVYIDNGPDERAADEAAIISGHQVDFFPPRIDQMPVIFGDDYVDVSDDGTVTATIAK